MKRVAKRVRDELRGNLSPRSKAAAILRKHRPSWSQLFYERDRLTARFSRSNAMKAGEELKRNFPNNQVCLFLGHAHFVQEGDGKISCKHAMGQWRITIWIPVEEKE